MKVRIINCCRIIVRMSVRIIFRIKEVVGCKLKVRGRIINGKEVVGYN